MKLITRLFVILTLTLGQLHCFADSDDKSANKLYIQASLIVKNLKNDINEKNNFISNYKKSHSLISKIITAYPSSDIAVKLVSEQAKISDFSLSEFNKIEHTLSLIYNAENSPISCAKLITYQQIKQSNDAKKIASFSSVYSKIGEGEKAEDNISKSLKIWEEIEDNSSKLNTAYHLSRFVVSNKNYQKLFNFVSTLSNKKDDTLSNYSGQFARAGFFNRAKETANLINSTKKLDSAYSYILSEEINKKNIPRILESTNIINNEFRKSIVQSKAIKLFLKSKDDGSAIKVYKQMESDKFKNVVIIIEHLTNAGQRDKAINILNEALKLEPKELYVSNGNRVGAIAILARLYYLNDDREKSKTLFKEAINIASSKSMHISKRAHALVSIARQYILIKERGSANRLLIKATEVTHKLKRLFKTRMMLGYPEADYHDIRNAYINSGQLKKAQAVQDKYMEEGDDIYKFNLVVAEYYINEGELEKALKYIKLEPWNDYHTPRIKTKMVSAYIKNKKVEPAKNLIDTMKEGYTKNNNIQEIIKYYLTKNKYEDAIAISQSFNSKLLQAEALADIGIFMQKEKVTVSNNSKKILTKIVTSINPLQVILE